LGELLDLSHSQRDDSLGADGRQPQPRNRRGTDLLGSGWEFVEHLIDQK